MFLLVDSYYYYYWSFFEDLGLLRLFWGLVVLVSLLRDFVNGYSLSVMPSASFWRMSLLLMFLSTFLNIP